MFFNISVKKLPASSPSSVRTSTKIVQSLRTSSLPCSPCGGAPRRDTCRPFVVATDPTGLPACDCEPEACHGAEGGPIAVFARVERLCVGTWTGASGATGAGGVTGISATAWLSASETRDTRPLHTEIRSTCLPFASFSATGALCPEPESSIITSSSRPPNIGAGTELCPNGAVSSVGVAS
jgi:hypothetical protein